MTIWSSSYDSGLAYKPQVGGAVAWWQQTSCDMSSDQEDTIDTGHQWHWLPTWSYQHIVSFTYLSWIHRALERKEISSRVFPGKRAESCVHEGVDFVLPCQFQFWQYLFVGNPDTTGLVSSPCLQLLTSWLLCHFNEVKHFFWEVWQSRKMLKILLRIQCVASWNLLKDILEIVGLQKDKNNNEVELGTWKMWLKTKLWHPTRK